ncbi:TRAP transporter 4TM/12TM fusion protein [Chromohalobacter marismortui]|uniref:TRAP transporter 4TM/12TM fusion protein n=1 Tax=Chromohalobacter marismortui TaxID=42055 RepID=A0A4R7NMG3_9GAMM|nr:MULTISPECIES: TRAP transporter fused permease subunit [Chromohalobacter]MCI0509628.1 TRAP transporter fused permease subunit [Chromohalobacter sp.]MCI0593697.1 TRAP transporter fused permease subunit [Chromohalobacter sp.]TDU21847.1 TRAP transporter 4TM/12TM fusion protein [Chromohalobacter marismortui]
MRDYLTKGLALALGGLILYTSAVGPFASLVQRSVFLALTLLLGLAIYPLGAGTRWRPLAIGIDLLLAASAMVACGYIAINQNRILVELPWATPLDMLMTTALVVTILELARRAIGWIFPLLVVTGLGYAFLGAYIPGPLGHRGFGPAFVTETLFLGDLGIWGMLVGVAATTIAAFVLFGGLLLHTGGGQTFMDLALRISGRSPGGAAKVATVASGLFGMVSGSAVANVATTGNFTIPMMKRLSYPRPFAAGVEAVASTGGQIAPPILGAAAFIMAEILGMSYVRIALAALLPAIFFYLGVFLTIHMVARRRELQVVPDDELPSWASVLRPERLIPILAALGGLFYGVLSGHSIQTSAFYGILMTVLFYTGFAMLARTAWRDIAGRLLSGLIDAGKGMVIIGVLLAGAQILVAMIGMTGIGVTLASLIVEVGGQSLFLVALIVGGVCLILGMGIPTTAAYVLVASVLAPALTEIGVEPLIAHLFVFYFATLSVITPPVCVAVFVASGIAQTNWLPAAGESVRLAAAIYVIPFLLLIYPALAGFGTWLDIVLAICQGVAFVTAFAALMSRVHVTGNRLLDVAGLALVIVLALTPGWLTTLAALGIMIGLYLRHLALVRKRSDRQPASSPHLDTARETRP